MKFICLCGGRGKRLGAIGNYLSKPMYPIGDRPFVAYSIDNVLATGLCDELVMVVGWRMEQPQTYFGSEYRGCPVRYVEQHPPSGTGAALHAAYSELRFAGQAEIVAWLADIHITQRDVMALMERPESTVLTLTLHQCEDHDHAWVVVNHAGIVLRCWPPYACKHSPLCDIGLWRLPLALLGRLGQPQADIAEVRTLQAVQQHIAAGERVGSVVAREWIHLGNEPNTRENLCAVWRRLTGEPTPQEHVAS